MRLDLRAVDGSMVELEFDAAANPTVSDVLHALQQPPYYYSPGVALMQGGKVLKGQCRMADFPPGSVVIAGYPSTPHTNGRHATSPGSKHNASPQQQRTRSPQASTYRGRHTASPAAERSIHFKTSNGHQFSVSFPADTTTQAVLLHLASRDPAFATARLVFSGRLLPIDGDHTLLSCGISDGATIHVALAAPSQGQGHPYATQSQPTRSAESPPPRATPSPAARSDASPQARTPSPARTPTASTSSNDPVERLLAVRQELDHLIAPFTNGAGDISSAPLDDRKGRYEATMRLLFKLDQLENLNPELRAQRKQLVMALQSFQDQLGITV